MNKGEISAAAIHGIGCELDDWLENSRRSEHELSGRVGAFKEMERDISSVLSLEEIESNQELVSKIRGYMSSQRGAAQDRHAFQRGFNMALERTIAFLNKRHSQALANAQNPNLHTHPDDSPGVQEAKERQRSRADQAPPAAKKKAKGPASK